MTDATGGEHEDASQLPTSPSISNDPLTRLWERADASHGHHLEAVAEFRARKRKEQETPARIRRRWRDGKRNAAGTAPPTHQPAKSPAIGELVTCERCRRTVERASAEQLEISSPTGEPTVHLMCSRCADEVRSGLLPLLTGAEPLPAPAQGAQEEQEAPPTIPARVGWFLVRLAAYALIALAVFAFVSWISVH